MTQGSFGREEIRRVLSLVGWAAAPLVGAGIPSAIGSVAGVPALFEALRTHGYDEPLLRKIGSENWLAALGRIWGG